MMYTVVRIPAKSNSIPGLVEHANDLAQALTLCFLLRRFSSFVATGYGDRCPERLSLAASSKSVFDQPRNAWSTCPGIRIYGPTASIPFQRYCTSIEAVSPKEAERLVLEEADDELIVAGVLEGEHDMVDEDPTLNPEDAEVASV